MHLHLHAADIVNGCFEFFGGAFNYLNVRRLRIDKKLRGASKWPTVVFTTWGVFNLYYYPSLEQWASFTGGCLIVTVNAWWVVLAIKYRKN